ncbi:hypothetical protein PPYR_12644 [Photinus pyralis]|uniref:L-xylulose reductase n=1 Tax=Photinus pyralis TaxID=7054 RepID=A0A5N4A6R6_PHOPY|nr:L-xylulose reductase-like [Photinus pyralis]XP_031354640.1 L-xylulose reductase-like [Photinus pyralis]XP_031355482.1 L-xylulose reductase-like [Photinus pyralis]KAB0793024.1 hypothetical protein PPYR_12644 [Photinus pyralis]
MDIHFNGKTALVSGAGRGIGNAIAKRLALCGAQVTALDINRDNLERLSEEVPSVKTICVDLSNWSETKEALKHVGQIDLLVNNAGIAILEPLADISDGNIDRLFSINFKAVVNLTQIVAQSLQDRNASGSIVNISSQTSMRGLREHAIYSSTKAAVDAFTRVAALELGGQNVRINCVNPTVVMTELGREVWSDQRAAEEMKTKIPLKRFAEVDEVVDAVLFLLSDKANMITGTCLSVDGGCLATL